MNKYVQESNLWQIAWIDIRKTDRSQLITVRPIVAGIVNPREYSKLIDLQQILMSYIDIISRKAIEKRFERNYMIIEM